MSGNKNLNIKGARLHNLKDISLEIPRNKITVVTGVSGSGKSSLAFDTIYAEGQRRFVQSLSAYARQFLERMGKPDVDSITGLPPAIAIEQKPPSRNPRSTVGTTTEIYDYLRLLYGRIGTTICRNCGKPVKKDTPDSVLKTVSGWKVGTKLYILFPIPPKSALLKDILAEFKEAGFFRMMKIKSSKILNLEDEIPQGVFQDELYILVDRLVLQKDEEVLSRIVDSIETSMRYGEGKCIIFDPDAKKYHHFSSLYECPDCEILYIEPEPKLFSFNNPYGACPKCQGFGRTIGIDMDLVIPDKSKSLRKGAVHPFRTQRFAHHQRKLIKTAESLGIDIDKPANALSEDELNFVQVGKGDYIGINGFYSMLEEKSYKVQYRVMMSRYRGYTKCYACSGSRLRTSARQVFIGKRNLPELIKMPLGALNNFFKELNLNKSQSIVAGQVLSEIKWRLQLLCDIGLEYLTLDRLSHTLSGGESQRINLSTALGSSLVGTLYVLDEPSIGMHPRDTGRLLKILYKLRNLGNTIIVVEHDMDIINSADHIVDIGPGAGENGGKLIFSGPAEKIKLSKESVTAAYLTGKKNVEFPKKRKVNPKNSITIIGPKANNLKMEKLDFPLNCMTVVTGVSGSGKSTLVHDILYAGLKKYKGGFNGSVGAHEKIAGGENLKLIEMVDQSPIGKSKRSTPATYTKVFDHIRELFSQTQAARQLGFKPGYFSFNVPGGRCDICDGEGSVTVDMQFLPDVSLECENCNGTRYKKEVRNIMFKGKSIVDVLDMTVDEALGLFEGVSRITKKLQILQDVGLGYLRLGQPSTMLSGGESQRIKLASHLEAGARKDSLFIFDEPTTGLHIDDISKLLDCFQRLVNRGNTVIIIEHNLHVVSAADWIIDLGPEAGEQGGYLVAEGTPDKIMKAEESYTGKALKEFFIENGD